MFAFNFIANSSAFKMFKERYTKKKRCRSLQEKQNEKETTTNCN